MNDQNIQDEADIAGAATALPPQVTFQSIKFSDGTTINLDERDIVVFVGPNNAGKSAALRELEQFVGSNAPQKVIQSVELLKRGSVDDLRSFLQKISRKQGEDKNLHYQGFRYNLSDRHLENYWSGNLDQFRSLFVMRIATESRITDSNPQGAIAVLDQSPSHPIHMLFADDELEKRISSYFHRAFGKDLIVFRAGGGNWPLLVGQRPQVEGSEDRISTSYNQRLRAQTVPLQEQGDGMRSFASVILHMLTPSTPSVLLLDEPEAFLHPPQARLLGEFIAKERPPHAQLFIATHSPDVLQGLLNVAPDHLRVLRIQRDGEVNRVKELDKAKAKAISSDPLMKFSGVMSGIFHQRVIVCESDADCLFYSTLLHLPQICGPQQPDVLFVQAAGKHRMAQLAEALRSLDVDVDVIADIDILNDEPALKKLVETLGGDWASVSSDSTPLKTAIQQHKPWLTAGEIKKGIEGVLTRTPADGEFPKELKSQIDAFFRKASPWDAIKDAGEAAIPAGQPTTHWQSLHRACSEMGLWIVPVGELEGFMKSEGGHGPRWAQKVIENYDLAEHTELQKAREFVKAIWNRKAPAQQEAQV